MIPSIEQGVEGDRRGRLGLIVRAPYDEQLVEDLKGEIPRPDRYWLPDLEAWWIDERHMDLVQHILLRHFPSVSVLGLEGEDDQLIQRDGSRAVQGRLL